jgi:hypothetical protein
MRRVERFLSRVRSRSGMPHRNSTGPGFVSPAGPHLSSKPKRAGVAATALYLPRPVMPLDRAEMYQRDQIALGSPAAPFAHRL